MNCPPSFLNSGGMTQKKSLCKVFVQMVLTWFFGVGVFCLGEFPSLEERRREGGSWSPKTSHTKAGQSDFQCKRFEPNTENAEGPLHHRNRTSV